MRKRFTATLSTESGMELFILVPFDVKAAFGKARAPVKVTLNGYTYASTVAVYGGKYFIPVRRSNRDAAKVSAGQELSIELELDDSERSVTVPTELAAAFKRNAALRSAWAALSFSHQREHAEAIERAKRPETRARRIAATLSQLTTPRPSKRATRRSSTS